MSEQALLNPALETVDLPKDLADQLTLAQGKLHKEYVVRKKPVCFVFIRFAVFFQALFGVALFSVVRVYLNQNSYITMYGVPLKYITPLAAGSLFFFSLMINGVLADYKEAEKIPAAMITAIEEYAHASKICIKEAEEKCADCSAAKVLLMRGRVLNHSISMLLFCKMAMDVGDEMACSFNIIMARCMHNIDELSQSFVKMIGHNPTVGATMNYPREVRKSIMQCRRIVDTDFWPVGYAFMWCVCIINLVVLFTIKTVEIAEYTVLPGMVFIFLFSVLMMRDVEDPFKNNVSQDPLNEIRDRFIIDLQDLVKDCAIYYRDVNALSLGD
jgi:hypothetical protein